MSSYTDGVDHICSASGVVTYDQLKFKPVEDNTYSVLYDNHKLVTEQISADRLQQYTKVVDLFDRWNNGSGFDDIGDWNNLYGDPYWRYTDGSIQFRTAGVLDSSLYTTRVVSPEYFNPSCLRFRHRSKDSAILTLLLTLCRFKPSVVAYRHHYQRAIIDQLTNFTGIGTSTAEKMYTKGVRDYKDILEHKHEIRRKYRNNTISEVREKITNGEKLLHNTDFIEMYKNQYMARNI